MTSWAVQPSSWGNELKANAEFGHSFDRIQDIALDWATDQMEAMTIWKVGTEAEFKWMEVNAWSTHHGHWPTTTPTIPTSCLTRNGTLTKNGKTKDMCSLIGSLRHSTPWSSDRITQVIPLYPSQPISSDERINLRSSHLWPFHPLLFLAPMRNCIRYWTNREPQRARLISVATYEQAIQTVEDFMNLGWRAEIAPPHIQWNGTAPLGAVF